MSDNHDDRTSCPECDGLDRRDFVRVLGGTAVTFASLQAVPSLRADDAPAAAPARKPTAKPAEALIRELHSSLTNEQKPNVVYAWNHMGSGDTPPMRRRMVNAPFARNIGTVYTRPQQELIERILKSMSSGEDGYRCLSRNGTFDGSHSLQGCGAYLFGEPTNDQQFSWVFQGHHITVRCDGNTEANVAFGGPIYYGHSPDGYSQRNCFNYQTRSVQSVYDSLNEAQRRKAIMANNPGELAPSVRFRADGAYPGIAASDLTADQRNLVRQVMCEILSPYRREDADEVMEIVGRNGGLEKIHLGFYRDPGANERWSFWRLEGPGFVWNYRVLPHVHTYVNIAAQA
jgi:hypothetical protein